MYDPLCTLVHSTEKGDVICYYGNRGEPEPIVLEPGESSLVGGDRVGGGGGGTAPLGTPLYFLETESLSYFSPETVCAFWPFVYVTACSSLWRAPGSHIRLPKA